MRRLLVVLLFTVLPFTVQAQLGGVGGGATNEAYDTLFRSLRIGQISPFGEVGVYNLNSSFSYQSTWGVTARHDTTSTTNSGSISLDNGFLAVASGTTSGSTAKLETVEYGRYQPGRAVEAGMGVVPNNLPTGSGIVAQWGLYTADNGAYWRIKDDDSDDSNELCVIYEAAGTENETCGIANFNGEVKPSGFDPVNDGAIYIIRMNWYGIGGAEYYAYYADESGNGTLSRWMMHRHSPSDGQSFEDPNLPIAAEVDNGSTTSNVEIHIGGRRYDIQGLQNHEVRESGDFRGSQSVAAADGLVPLICARRASDFPTAGRRNTVSAFVRSFDVETDQDVSIYFAYDPDVSGGSWTTPTNKVDSETAIETNKGVTGLSGVSTISGPFGIGTSGTGTNETGITDANRDLRVHLPTTEPVCLAADIVGSTDATITSWIRVVEGW